MLGRNCTFARAFSVTVADGWAAIADSQLQLQMFGCNCRTAQEGIGAKAAQLQLQIANTLCRPSAQARGDQSKSSSIAIADCEIGSVAEETEAGLTVCGQSTGERA